MIFTRIIIITLVIAASAYAQSTITGTVTEKGTGEVVVGANVIVTGTVRGAATNSYGYFAIPDVKPGKYTLRVSAIGYKTDTVAVDLRTEKSVRLAVELPSVSIEIGEVVVEADREPLETRTIGTVEVPMEQIYRIPTLGGEADIFRALLLLPGIQSSSEISSGLHVRGGSPDQNLVLLDKMVLYNPYHLGGFMSTFNSDAINHVKIIKGTMPAEYGGRLSSVIDVTMKEGGNEEIHGSGGISMIDSRLTLNGPLTDGATFMISGRRVYIDWLSSMFSDDALPYYFYDLVAKTNIKIDEDNRLFFSGFFGKDVLEYEDDGGQIDWGNTAFNLRWTRVLGSKWFSNVSLVYSDYTFNMEEKDYHYELGEKIPDEIFRAASGIEDISLRAELEYFHSAEHSVKTGFELYAHAFTSEATDQIEEFVNFFGELPQQRSTQFSFFVQDDWQVSKPLKLHLGARMFYFDRGQYLRAEPRFSALYTLGDGTVLKAAVVGANQFLHLVNRTDLALPIDMWFPSTSSIRPSYAMQYTLGATRTLFDDYLVTVEGYYKNMERILEFKDDAEFSFLIPLEDELTSGNGEAYGVEFMFQRKVGAITGWISYTLAWAERKFPELNYGKPFPPRYDKRHDISIVANYRLGESWEFTATWVYSTGNAVTFPIAQYTFDGSEAEYLYTDRNGYRMPAYHRLDLNFSHAFRWFGWDWKASINIYNTYNQLNPFIRYVDKEYEDDWQTYKNVMKQGTLLPFLPTFGLSFRF